MVKIKFIANFFYVVVILSLMAIALFSAMSVLGLPQNFRAFVVQSGSMEPAVKTGSLIFVKPFPEYRLGDIVTFKSGPDVDIKNPRGTITHRLVEIKKDGDLLFYVTKGDANDTPDAEVRPSDYVIGKVVFSVPYIGFPVGYAKTQNGFILLVVIPATIIIYSELINIKKSIISIIKKRHGQKA